MSWKHFVFGKEAPSRARVVGSLFAYPILAMAIHGWFAPVVPVPWLRGMPGATIMLALSLALAVAFALATVPVRPPRVTQGSFGYPQVEDRGDTGQPMLFAVGMAILMAPILWLALGKSLPWMLAGAFGVAHEETTTLRLEHGFSRRSCDYRAYGPVLEATVPNYLCISREAYEANPERTMTVRLLGRTTAVGWRIDGFRVVEP